jgi:hypothetical protein
MPGRASKHYELWTTLNASFVDSEFTGGQLYTLYPEVRFTNCLLNGVFFFLDDSSIGMIMNPLFQNCTFAGGEWFSYHGSSPGGGVWTFKNNIFKGIAFTNVVARGTVISDYNAYSGCVQQFTTFGLHDQIVTVPFESGPLGRFYLPTNSPLINAGNQTASSLGLYHHTTQVEQRKENTTVVDIGYHYVALGEPASNTAWVDDTLPTGAVSAVENDVWTWLSSPAPAAAGSLFHRSAAYASQHQHSFDSAQSTLTFGPDDVFYVYVRLGYANLPGDLMLQWKANDSTGWFHRAYWGSDQLSSLGTRRYMGPLPVTNAWVRLEVPALEVGLVGKTITGLAFTLYGGTVDWDYAGKRTTRGIVDTDGDGIPDVIEDRNGNGDYDVGTGETRWAQFISPDGLTTGKPLLIFTPLR